MDIPLDPTYFYLYKKREGPWMFYFEQSENLENKEFCNLIESKRKAYPGVPLIKYNYIEFMKIWGFKYCVKFNDILIIENIDNHRIYHNPDLTFLEKKFKEIENKRLLYKQKNVKIYDPSKKGHRKKLQAWKPKPRCIRFKRFKNYESQKEHYPKIMNHENLTQYIKNNCKSNKFKKSSLIKIPKSRFNQIKELINTTKLKHITSKPKPDIMNKKLTVLEYTNNHNSFENDNIKSNTYYSPQNIRRESVIKINPQYKNLNNSNFKFI